MNIYIYLTVELPESLFKSSESVLLHNNQLTSLPESFGELTVSGSVLLHDNQLTSLPESFGKLTLNLSLGSNQCRPHYLKNFGNLTVEIYLCTVIN